ncbi:hypothetical protein [Rhizobium leguminosarum]|uniref:virion core protein, T7 gp14 family n=1 Tax=Rhizobium leguminosarum TaxID=384 RepID=UPI001C953D9C|nr:hypothetical protein [Rhizobium leguminosarum]MBY5581859.1 hypothetical protein [Rhizobium leguminosarum]
MCDPISLASFAIGAAGQVSSFMSASQEAETQNKLAENNRIEANRAAADQYASIQERMLQEKAAAGRELETANKDAAKARATASVTSGEAGVTGISVDSLLADYNAQQGQFERTNAQNLKMTQDGLRDQLKSVKANAEGRINSVQKVAKPSLAPFVIGIAGSGLDAYTAKIKRNTE